MQSFPLELPWPVRALLGCLAVAVGLSLAIALFAGMALALLAGIAMLFDGDLRGLGLLALAMLPTLILTFGRGRPSKLPRAEDRPVPRVDVGSDGIALHRLRETFVPWARVRSVQRTNDRVAIELDDGRIERLRSARAHALERAVLEEKARHDSAHRSTAIRSLEPDGELDDAWVRRVRGLIGEPAYRVESVDEGAVLAVLEDPAQRAVQRIGAALALSGASEPAVKRVRVAIENTAEPALAQALRDAEAGDLDGKLLKRVVSKFTDR